MKYKFLILSLIFIISLLIVINNSKKYEKGIDDKFKTSWWEVQSIDTVKYSRDVAREKLNEKEFDKVIDMQVKLIAQTGATHIAIGTPYDPEFIPFLRRWVSAARKNGLSVWFRGNLSGWESWFGYNKISRSDHINNIHNFILDNKDIFADGDIFSSCPECENGGDGDPRITKDVTGFRNFLVDEYNVSKKYFENIGKNVRSNYFSMNADVARLVMDKETTKKLDGIVVIDHYVSSPTKLARDIKDIAQVSGGKVVLGEFGTPIPDINGKLTETEQSEWLNEALSQIAVLPELVGVNYWTGYGGSTAIWNDDLSAKSSVKVITGYYKPDMITGIIRDEIGLPVKNATVRVCTKSELTGRSGDYDLPNIRGLCSAEISAMGFDTQIIDISTRNQVDIVMVKSDKNLLFKVQVFIKSYFRN